MSVVESIKSRLLSARKDKNEKVTSILRVALGEIQTHEARSSRQFKDEDAVKVIEQVITSNIKSLEHAEGERAVDLKKENEILQEFLPRYLSQSDIHDFLQNNLLEQIRACRSDKQAVGVAMSAFKKNSLAVKGADVVVVVSQLFSSAES